MSAAAPSLIHASAEVRWFFEGDVPANVARWFAAFEPVEEPARSDRYAVLKGALGLGVKLRSGRFEIKTRTGSERSTLLAPRAMGPVEEWLKWSLAGDWTVGLAATLGELDQPVAIDVAKERQLVRLSLIDGNVQRSPAGEVPGTGCRVELATVDVQDERWWTLGAEAYADAACRRATLRACLASLLRPSPPPLNLPAVASAAYPKWLQQWAYSSN